MSFVSTKIAWLISHAFHLSRGLYISQTNLIDKSILPKIRANGYFLDSLSKQLRKPQTLPDKNQHACPRVFHSGYERKTPARGLI